MRVKDEVVVSVPNQRLYLTVFFLFAVNVVFFDDDGQATSTAVAVNNISDGEKVHVVLRRRRESRRVVEERLGRR